MSSTLTARSVLYIASTRGHIQVARISHYYEQPSRSARPADLAPRLVEQMSYTYTGEEAEGHVQHQGTFLAAAATGWLVSNHNY